MLSCWATCNWWRQSWPASAESKVDTGRFTTLAPAPVNPSSTYISIFWAEERCIGPPAKNRLEPLNLIGLPCDLRLFFVPRDLVLVLVLLLKAFLRFYNLYN